MELLQRVQKAIRDVPDFPEPGILFKDITPIFQDPKLCQDILDKMYQDVRDLNIDVVVGVESRGFFFGLPLSWKLDCPFVPIRKKGKLPYETVDYSYDLEYGSAEVEMHIDAISKGQRVLVHDDLLATGGTALAAAELVKKVGGEVVGFSFLVELSFLLGKDHLHKVTGNIFNLAEY